MDALLSGEIVWVVLPLLILLDRRCAGPAPSVELQREDDPEQYRPVLHSVSQFGGGNRAEKKRGVIERLAKFFEKYLGVA